MHVSELSLKNFRNYTEQTIKLSPGTNLIFGQNAQGKTNILEAVYMFSQGKSHRAKSDREMIRFGNEFARAAIEFETAEREYRSVMTFAKNGKKTIKINNVPIKKLSMLMNYLNTVMFSPEDLSLVKGSPSVRRRFMDLAVSQLSPKYLISLIDYGKALNQKNSLLKELRRSGKTKDVMLSVWNEQLSTEGAKIMKYRLDFLELLGKFASQIQKEISGESLEIEYAPGIKLKEISAEEYYETLEKSQRREIELQTAIHGIQRDDINLRINGSDSKLYASQGQQRTAALTLKIALSDYIHSIKDEYPVLLLDDIMSELDKSRRLYLAEKIKDKQVLITSTDTDILKSTDGTKLFYVEAGSVKEV